MSAALPADSSNKPSAWHRFWFAPGDPTTLGFMRVVTGLLVVYTHLTYSLDLQAFFGNFGWYGASYVERERKEAPSGVSAFFEWEDKTYGPRLPEYPHRRQAVLHFVRNIAEDRTNGPAATSYLEHMAQFDRNPEQPALNMILSIVEETAETKRPTGVRDMLLNSLALGHQLYISHDGIRPIFDPKEPTAASKNPGKPFFPQLLLQLSQDERAAAAQEARAMIAVLPPNLADDRYAILHLMELDPAGRAEFAKFLRSLPNDTAERLKIIDYLGSWNADPRKADRVGNSVFSVWFHVTDPTQMAIIHGIILFVMVLFTVGFCTRVTSVLTWLAAIGYIHRTQQVLFGMDTMMNILLIYLMIGNSGATLSIDRMIARYRAARAGLRRSGSIDARTAAYLASPPPSVSANLAIRLVQVHFCIIYLVAGLAKLKGPAWWNGRAFWDVMVNQEFTLMRYEWYENGMRAIASIKPLYYGMIAGGVWFTLFLEIGLPFLIWTRLRPLMIWLAVLLHAAIGILMGLNLFELFMMAMLLAFIPSSVIRSRLTPKLDPEKLRFAFNPADPHSQRAAAIVAGVDADCQVELEQIKDAPAPSFASHGVPPQTGAPALAELFARVRMLRLVRPVLWVPGVSGLLVRIFFPNRDR